MIPMTEIGDALKLKKTFSVEIFLLFFQKDGSYRFESHDSLEGTKTYY